MIYQGTSFSWHEIRNLSKVNAKSTYAINRQYMTPCFKLMISYGCQLGNVESLCLVLVGVQDGL